MSEIAIVAFKLLSENWASSPVTPGLWRVASASLKATLAPKRGLNELASVLTVSGGAASKLLTKQLASSGKRLECDVSLHSHKTFARLLSDSCKAEKAFKLPERHSSDLTLSEQLPAMALGKGAQEESNCCQRAERECKKKKAITVAHCRGKEHEKKQLRLSAIVESDSEKKEVAVTSCSA